MFAKLLVLEGSTTVKEITLRRARTVAGRKKGCKLRIRSQLVSRIHCSLVCDGSRLRIKDLGSSNGTFVNGTRVTEAALSAGDIIQIGPVKFVVQLIGSQVAGGTQASDAPPTTQLPDGEVIFFQSEDEPDGAAEEVVEAEIIEEWGGDAEFAAHAADHAPVSQPQNIFTTESDEALDAEQFLISGDDAGDGGYGLVDAPDLKPRR